MKVIAFWCCFILSLGAFAQERPLYPNGPMDNLITHPFEEMFVDSLVHPKSLTGKNRVFSYVSEPTYMIFPAKKENNRKVGVVIYPGGGLKNVWLDKEGTDIALWLSEQGITCMVVKYRTNRKDDEGKWEINYGDYRTAVQEDARTSMLTMKALADSLDFDKSKIGMMGFSAGGWLVEQMVYKYYKGDSAWNPAFVALIYHGSNVSTIKQAKEKEKLPPFFMAIAQNDAKMPVDKVIPYLEMVAAEVKKSELHVYPDGGHGFGLAYDENSSAFVWKNAFVSWIDGLYK